MSNKLLDLLSREAYALSSMAQQMQTESVFVKEAVGSLIAHPAIRVAELLVMLANDRSTGVTMPSEAGRAVVLAELQKEIGP